MSTVKLLPIIKRIVQRKKHRGEFCFCFVFAGVVRCHAVVCVEVGPRLGATSAAAGPRAAQAWHGGPNETDDERRRTGSATGPPTEGGGPARHRASRSRPTTPPPPPSSPPPPPPSSAAAAATAAASIGSDAAPGRDLDDLSEQRDRPRRRPTDSARFSGRPRQRTGRASNGRGRTSSSTQGTRSQRSVVRSRRNANWNGRELIQLSLSDLKMFPTKWFTCHTIHIDFEYDNQRGFPNLSF